MSVIACHCGGVFCVTCGTHACEHCIAVLASGRAGYLEMGQTTGVPPRIDPGASSSRTRDMYTWSSLPLIDHSQDNA
jgi:hypothetical protein